MNDPVPVTREITAERAARFCHQPAPAFCCKAGIGLQSLPYHVSIPRLDIYALNSDIWCMTTPSITVTPRAAKRILEITGGNASAALRVAVNGGGCSGFQYEFGIATDRSPEDRAFQQEGATVLVDDVSLNYMAGSVLDFEDNLMGQSFKVLNPLAKSSCGCGTSFSF